MLRDDWVEGVDPNVKWFSGQANARRKLRVVLCDGILSCSRMATATVVAPGTSRKAKPVAQPALGWSRACCTAILLDRTQSGQCADLG